MARKRKSTAKPKPAPIAALEVIPEPVVEEPTSLTSRLFLDRRDFASDARTVVQMISLGVVEERRAADLLKRMFDRVEDTEVSNRDLAAFAKVFLAAAKLGIEVEKLDRPVLHQHAHLHAHGSPRTTDGTRDKLSEIARKRGVPGLFGRSPAPRSR